MHIHLFCFYGASVWPSTTLPQQCFLQDYPYIHVIQACSDDTSTFLTPAKADPHRSFGGVMGFPGILLPTNNGNFSTQKSWRDGMNSVFRPPEKDNGPFKLSRRIYLPFFLLRACFTESLFSSFWRRSAHETRMSLGSFTARSKMFKFEGMCCLSQSNIFVCIFVYSDLCLLNATLSLAIGWNTDPISVIVTPNIDYLICGGLKAPQLLFHVLLVFRRHDHVWRLHLTHCMESFSGKASEL